MSDPTSEYRDNRPHGYVCTRCLNDVPDNAERLCPFCRNPLPISPESEIEARLLEPLAQLIWRGDLRAGTWDTRTEDHRNRYRWKARDWLRESA